MFVSRHVSNGARYHIFDVVARRAFMDPKAFSTSVSHLTLESLVPRMVYNRSVPFTPEASMKFIDEHFPPRRPLRHLIDHVLTIDPTLDISPTHIIRRMTRDRTILDNSLLNFGSNAGSNTEAYNDSNNEANNHSNNEANNHSNNETNTGSKQGSLRKKQRTNT